jgi:hypothetical protein
MRCATVTLMPTHVVHVSLNIIEYKYYVESNICKGIEIYDLSLCNLVEYVKYHSNG